MLGIPECWRHAIRAGAGAVVLAAAATQPADAAPTDARAAQLLIHNLGRSIVSIMQAGATSNAERNTSLSRLLVERVDFDGLARFTLGPHAERADKASLAEFTDYFAAHIIDEALTRFTRSPISDVKIHKMFRQGDGDVIVLTDIVNGSGDPLRAGWRVRGAPPDVRIVDVLDEGGNSMGMHFRNRYERQMSIGGLPGLIRRLRSMTAGYIAEGVEWVRGLIAAAGAGA